MPPYCYFLMLIRASPYNYLYLNMTLVIYFLADIDIALRCCGQNQKKSTIFINSRLNIHIEFTEQK